MEYKDIKEIIKDMGESKIDELKIEFPDGTKISMKKNEVNTNVVSIQNNEEVKKEITSVETTKEPVRENYKEIKSPMVGTFYSKSSPTAKPFVKVGDKVRKGDVVCIVEAMKLMNEIESEFDGEIVEICKNDEDMCEYGDCLFKIK
mgnify:FL=1